MQAVRVVGEGRCELIVKHSKEQDVGQGLLGVELANLQVAAAHSKSVH